MFELHEAYENTTDHFFRMDSMYTPFNGVLVGHDSHTSSSNGSVSTNVSMNLNVDIGSLFTDNENRNSFGENPDSSKITIRAKNEKNELSKDISMRRHSRHASQDNVTCLVVDNQSVHR